MTRKILLVDDSPFICAALGMALREAGYQVDVARDLAELEQASGPAPDLALMDVVLPEAFGDDIATLLRATGKLACPILLMSGLPEDELAERVRDTGLDGYISKQGGLAAMLAAVQKFLGRATPAPGTAPASAQFEVSARQRMRRVLQIAARPERWNSAAILGELHALAGDADLIGAREVAQAARASHDKIARLGVRGPQSEAIDALVATARLVGAQPSASSRNVLLLDDSDTLGARLLAPLDSAGHVVVDGRTIAEARQKLRATAYAAVVVNGVFAAREPQLIAEVRASAPNANVVVIEPSELAGDAALAKILDVLR